MRLFRTSVKEDLNVAGVFQSLSENYVSKVKSFDDEGDFSDGFPSDPAAQLAQQLNMIQIGIGSRPYVTKKTPNNNKKQAPLTQANHKKAKINSNNGMMVGHNNSNNIRRHMKLNNNSNNGYGGINSKRQQHNGYGWQQPHYHGYRGGGGGGGGGGGSSFSPQDYLNNPMFDSLHHRHSRAGRYWPNSANDVVTLRPLSTIAKKNGNRKHHAFSSACKVL